MYVRERSLSVVEGATLKDSFKADKYDDPVSSPPAGAAVAMPGAVFLAASVLRLALDATLKSPSPEVRASTALLGALCALAACCC